MIRAGVWLYFKGQEEYSQQTRLPGSFRFLTWWKGHRGSRWPLRILGALPAHVLEGVWQGAVLVQAEVGHHEREGGRHPEVGDEADEKGRDDAHGDGLLGVLDLLPCKEQGVSGGLGTTPWRAALWGPGPSPGTTDHDTHKPRDSVLGLHTDGRQGRLAAFSREHAGGPGARPVRSPGRWCF